MSLVLGLFAFAALNLNAADHFTKTVQPILNEYCARCHGESDKTKGDVDLHALSSQSEFAADPEFLQLLSEVIEFREMPPEDEPDLPPNLRNALSKAIEEALDGALEAPDKSLPRVPIRRMTRFQYNNAVQDLFDLKVEVFSLPERILREYGDYFQPATQEMPDQLTAGCRPLGKSQLIEPRLGGVAAFPQDLRAEHGFDTRADLLSLSPFLLEQFFEVSQSIFESDDFNETNCGVWHEVFAEPQDATTPSQQRQVIKERLNALLTQAFREPVDEPTLENYTEFATHQLDNGASFVDAIKSTASAILASPRFFYLYQPAIETTDSTRAYQIASRLSFFLWGSIPDKELLSAAENGVLLTAKGLREQVDRLLKDDRLKRFSDSFPAQWLQLDRIVSSVPDPEEFPEFYFAKYRASMDMVLEPLLLFETILVENRSILELIHSDFSYRTPRLRAWYGESVSGGLGGPVTLKFKRTPVESLREGGVITTAAVMTMTSAPKRTQPITRGAWVASVIFNAPPEPPPGDVPPLTAPSKAEANLTLRERLAAHRDQPDCAACHEKIDPFGFALENYNEAGVWRDQYANGREVDPSGTLFREFEFQSIEEFKKALLSNKTRFTRAFAGHLLSYALGRELVPADNRSLNTIVEETERSDYQFQELLHQIVASPSFLEFPSRNERNLSLLEK